MDNRPITTHCTLQLLEDAHRFLTHVHEIAVSHGMEVEPEPREEALGINYYAWKTCPGDATDGDDEDPDEQGFTLSSGILLQGNAPEFVFDCWYSDNWDGESVVDYHYWIVGKPDIFRVLPTIWSVMADPEDNPLQIQTVFDYFGLKKNHVFRTEAEAWLTINRICAEANRFLNM